VVIVLAAAAIGVTYWLDRESKVRWARDIAVPEIRRLIDDSLRNPVEAFRIAKSAAPYLSGDPEFKALLAEISVETALRSEPPGASVWVKPYAEPDGPWELVGQTPVEHYRAPLAYLRWKVVKEGFETIIHVRDPGDWDEERKMPLPGTIEWTLDEVGVLPDGMVRVPGNDEVPSFLIDRFEVSNRQFKGFVDAGGYRNASFWNHKFVRDGNVLSPDEAMKEFVDNTGIPGPSTWEAGDYPDGQDDHPVMGISWYEAAAYADYAGKFLPTIEHWEIAAGHYFRGTMWTFPSFLIPISNFSGEGPVPVGGTQAISPFGVSDMAGNVAAPGTIRPICSGTSARHHPSIVRRGTGFAA
jgi:hypothetical protein